jgi:hypothetical protein
MVPPPGPDPAAEEEGMSVPLLAWIGFGVGGAGLLLGAITGGIAAGKASSIKEDCVDDACPPERRDDIDSATTLAHVATAGFVVAGVGATVGVVALLVGSSSASAEATAALPFDVRLGPGTLGLQGRLP